MDFDYKVNEKHIQINQDFSTIVVKYIIDKIILRATREINNKYYDIKFPNICVDYSLSMINKLMSISKINYDINDYDDKEIKFSLNDKSNNKREKLNTWIEIYEPGRTEPDREMTNLIKVIHHLDNNSVMSQYIPRRRRNSLIIPRDSKEIITENFNTIYKDKNKEKDNYANDIAQILNKIKERMGNIDKDNSNKNNNNKQEINEIILIKNDEEGEEDNEKEIDKMKKIYDSFPAFDIPNFKPLIPKEPPESNQLRYEYQMKKVKKEEDSQQVIKKEKEEKKKRRFEIFKNKFPIDTSKYTFDSNGKIMYLKRYDIESLQKDLKLIPSWQKTINKPNKIKSLNNEITNQDNKKEIIADHKSKDEGYEFRKTKRIIGGSNYLLIKPETGVLIKEDKKEKVGDFNFQLKYNKSSIYDYYQKISSLNQISMSNNNLNKKFLSLSKSTSRLLNTKSISKENQEKKDSSDEEDNAPPYIGFKEEINENNPLFQNSIKINQNIDYLKKSKLKKKLLPNISIKKSPFNINLKGINKPDINSINTSRKNIKSMIFISERFKEYQNSLISEASKNKNNLLNIYDGQLSKRIINRSDKANIINNIFKLKKKEGNKNLDEMIKFTKNILKNEKIDKFGNNLKIHKINKDLPKLKLSSLSPSYKHIDNKYSFSNRQRRIFSGNSNLIRNRSQIYNDKLLSNLV